jgi:hypothetical protein
VKINPAAGIATVQVFRTKARGFEFGISRSTSFWIIVRRLIQQVDYQMPGALTKEQMEQNRRQYQPAMPLYWMKRHPTTTAPMNTRMLSRDQILPAVFRQFELKMMYVPGKTCK